jgi:mono/diheme cytochrome c family protein
MTSVGARLLSLVAACVVLSGQGPAAPADDRPPEQKLTANMPFPRITDTEKSEAKAIFAAQCAWCHGNYGMTADKGPRLAGTQMTEQQVQTRIHNGEPGYMPSFQRFLNHDQIELMAKYIKSLNPDD